MATLKISDLSVGDWVLCGEDTTPYKIIGIDSNVHPNVTLCDSYYPQGVIAFLDMIRPIPITAEILEKIGFAKGQRGDFYHYLRLDKNRTLYIHASTNGWRVEVTYDAAGILRTTHLMPDINSVHQFQHALRLAEVNKEINL